MNLYNLFTDWVLSLLEFGTVQITHSTQDTWRTSVVKLVGLKVNMLPCSTYRLVGLLSPHYRPESLSHKQDLWKWYRCSTKWLHSLLFSTSWGPTRCHGSRGSSVSSQVMSSRLLLLYFSTNGERNFSLLLSMFFANFELTSVFSFNRVC